MDKPHSNRPARPTAASSGPGLRDVVVMIRQHLLVAICAALLLSGLLGFYKLNQTPVYRAAASMLVEFNSENIINVQEVVEEGAGNYSVLMKTHLERLKGRSMALFVAESLSPEQRLRIYTAGMTPEERAAIDPDSLTPERMAGRLMDAINADWLSGSQVLRVSAHSTVPALAQLLANRYVESYIRLQLNSRNFSTDQAVAFLDEQTVIMRQRLSEEEDILQNYRRENDMVSVEQNQQIISQRLNQLSNAITATRVELLAVQSRLEQLNAAGEDLDALLSIPVIHSSPAVQEINTTLENLRRERVILSERYLERHPSLLRNEASTTAARDSLLRAISQAKLRVVAEKNSLDDELSRLTQEYKSAEEEALRLEKLSIEYRALERKVQAMRDTFDLVNERFNETIIAQQKQQMNLTTLRPIDPAQLPQKPISPNRKRILFLSAFVFIATFVGVPIGLELVDNRLKTFHDIEHTLEKPILGDLQHIRGKKESEIAQLVDTGDDEISESFSSLYGALKLNIDAFKAPLRLIVTSTIPSEGKSVVAANLAEVLAKHQLRTILIDCDLRRPSLHRYLNLNNKVGLLPWMRSDTPDTTQSLEKNELLAIQQMGSTGRLFVLPAGGSTKQPTAILENPKFDALISELSQSFDALIFDTPPIGLFPDATFVSPFADHTIFVARQGQVSRQKARHAINIMDRSRAPVIGCFLNGVVDPKMAAGYGYASTRYDSQYQYGHYAKKYKDHYRSEENIGT